MKIPVKQYWNLFVNYLSPQKARIVVLAITLLGSIGLQLLNPQILRYFIDTAVAGGSKPALLTAAGLFISVAMVTQVLAVATTYLGKNVAWTATNALRVDLAQHCLKLDLSFHKSLTPGELIERVDGDVNNLSTLFSEFTLQVLGNVILLVGVLLILFCENWIAGFSLTFFTITALVILVKLHSSAVPSWAAYRQVSAEFFGFLGEQLAGMADLRANGASSYVMHRFYLILQCWLPIYHKARFVETILWGTTIGLFALGYAIALTVGTYLWSQGAITIGKVYLIFYYTNLLGQPVQQIVNQLEDLQQAEASIYRIKELFSVKSQLSADGDQPLPDGALSVSFENVSFSYGTFDWGTRGNPRRASVGFRGMGNSGSPLGIIEKASHEEFPDLNGLPVGHASERNNKQTLPNPQSKELVLQNISFYLPPGQVLGLLGRTGSGKTTLARLLLRLYDPQEGCVRLGGVTTNSTLYRDLRQRVGLVTQDVQLFQTTVRNNLTFFNPQIGDSQLQDTLLMLGLSEWLQLLPNGLDTQLGSDSRGLSAGEAQLLAFVRVFLQNPGLVVLDEASSRLDPTTEKLIEQAVDKLLLERTGVIIAHRLKTVQRADQILILENGQIIEYGERENLANNSNSRFASLLKTGLTDVLA